MDTGQINVLLADDDEADVELMIDLFEESKIKLNLSVVSDGVQVMNFVRKVDQYIDSSTPDLILLDLNMPRKSGRETLEEIKSDSKLRHIPVVILTTSDSNIDIVKSYTSGASCYITKPVGLEQLRQVVSSIENFWFSIVKYPQP
ncbi:response regulator [Spirochaeta cellobiosiphila]|uniref:response regulator n=1 Tax=Spirochaeta cellobiosiphila TaxID=504483 RepID=UPI00041EB503|nr:response regulator [Spirochaeta cellobiosiphila]